MTRARRLAPLVTCVLVGCGGEAPEPGVADSTLHGLASISAVDEQEAERNERRRELTESFVAEKTLKKIKKPGWNVSNPFIFHRAEIR